MVTIAVNPFRLVVELKYLVVAFIVFLILFFIGSAMAVYFFVSNLSKLAQSRRQTITKMNVTKEEIHLDKVQLQLVHLAARYVLLYGIASSSSLLFTGCSLVLTLGGNMEDIPVQIDCCINLLCLYLQFGIARNHYQFCCGRLDGICRKVISKRTRGSIHKLSMEHTLRSNSGTSTPQSTNCVREC